MTDPRFMMESVVIVPEPAVQRSAVGCNEAELALDPESPDCGLTYGSDILLVDLLASDKLVTDSCQFDRL
jgi:hypothetical protein